MIATSLMLLNIKILTKTDIAQGIYEKYGGIDMNVTELMIGDWVYDTILQSNAKIQAIQPLTIRCDINTEHHLYCEFNPIHLTPEILEKNGWKETAYWHEYQDGKNIIQCCLPDMRGRINGIEIEHFKCEYVHQYQHLLRLCGLNELADNFKI